MTHTSEYYADDEPICTIVRVWNQPHPTFGDPYVWSACIRWIDSESVEVTGADKPLTEPMWLALREWCIRRGIKMVLRVTYPSGQRRERWREVG